MKRMMILAAALTLVVGSLNVASAQGGGGGGRRGGGFGQFGGGRGMGGGVDMLARPDVQGELKMTPPQIEKVAGKQQEVQQARREMFQNGGGGGQPDPEAFRAMQAKIQEMQTKAVNDILDTKQQKRFKQLELQQAGPNALLRKDVQDELKMTDDQKTKVGTIQRDAMTAMRDSMQGVDLRNMAPEERTKFFEKMQAAQKATGEKMATVLTDAQKAQWKAMQGEPFKFAPTPPGGPGRGNRPGGGAPPPPFN